MTSDPASEVIQGRNKNQKVFAFLELDSFASETSHVYRKVRPLAREAHSRPQASQGGTAPQEPRLDCEYIDNSQTYTK